MLKVNLMNKSQKGSICFEEEPMRFDLFLVSLVFGVGLSGGILIGAIFI